MYHAIQQTYRHTIQQYIVQQEMCSLKRTPTQGISWESGGIFALVSAAATCGLLAQVHLG